MRKISITIFLLLFVFLGIVHSKTRQELVNDALDNETITSWIASTDTYVFGSNGHVIWGRF